MDTEKKSCSCAQTCKPSCAPICVDNDTIFKSGICDPSRLDFSTYKYWTELSVPGMISVPEAKPDIEQIDSVNATVQIVRKQVIITPASTTNPANYEGKKLTGRKLIIEGLICLKIGYVSSTCDQSVHTFEGKLPFSAFIVVPINPISGDTTTDALDVCFKVPACLEDIFVKEFCDRHVKICSTLLLQAIPVPCSCNDDCLGDSNSNCRSTHCNNSGCQCDDIQPDIKGVCPENKITSLLDDDSQYWTEFFIPEILNIPHQKPNIEQILSITSKIEIMCQKVIQTPTAVANFEGTMLTGKKLIIEGMLKQRIVYTAKKEDQSVHSAHFDVPFSAFIIVPDTTNFTDKFKIQPCIEDIFVCALNERQIFKNVTIFIKATPLVCA